MSEAVLSDIRPEPGAALARVSWRSAIASATRARQARVGLALTALILLVAFGGPYAAPHSPTEFVGPAFSGPSADAPAGTDYLGRDVLSRFLMGGRSVITLSVLATILGVGLGVALGVAAAYSRSWADDVIMRGLDVLLAFPQIVFALLLVSVVGPKLWLIVVAVALTHTPNSARVARGASLAIVEQDFVKSAEASGLPRRQILFSEILPNIASAALVEVGVRLTLSIALIAGLSFLGLGIQPPSPNWGLMVNENRLGLTAQPWAVLVPVLGIAVLTVGTNLIADVLARARGGRRQGGSD